MTPKAVLDLGKLLASDLDSTDTLGRWMAHYLAERIHGLEHKSGPEKAAAESEVMELILRLWSLRRELPVVGSPFSEVDEVGAAITRLAPGRKPWAYSGIFSLGVEPNAVETEASPILKRALMVDHFAGELVNSLVVRAAELSEFRDSEWIRHAAQFGDESLGAIRRFRLANGGSSEPQGRVERDIELVAQATALVSVVSELLKMFDASAPGGEEGSG